MVNALPESSAPPLAHAGGRGRLPLLNDCIRAPLGAADVDDRERYRFTVAQAGRRWWLQVHHAAGAQGQYQSVGACLDRLELMQLFDGPGRHLGQLVGLEALQYLARCILNPHFDHKSPVGIRATVPVERNLYLPVRLYERLRYLQVRLLGVVVHTAPEAVEERLIRVERSAAGENTCR